MLYSLVLPELSTKKPVKMLTFCQTFASGLFHLVYVLVIAVHIADAHIMGQYPHCKDILIKKMVILLIFYSIAENKRS